MNTSVLAMSVLSATIIGAGIFSLPYVFHEVGLLIGFAYLAVTAIVLSLVHMMYADIILRTDRKPKFVDYARDFLGEWSYLPATIVTVFGVLFSTTIYLVLAPKFANLIFGSVSAPPVIFLFWILGAAAIFFRIKTLNVIEFIIGLGILLIAALLFVLGLKNLPGAAPAWPSAGWTTAFILPFGPVLFSLYGRSAIPSLLESFGDKNQYRSIAKSIRGGTIIPAVIYGLFVLGVLGLSPVVSQDTVTGLLAAPPWLLGVLGIFGIIALYSTYIVLGISVKDILQFDLGVPHLLSASIVIATPMAIYLLGLRDFLTLVSISGGVFASIEILLILFIWRAVNCAGNAPALLPRFKTAVFYIFAALFAFGFLYELSFILL